MAGDHLAEPHHTQASLAQGKPKASLAHDCPFGRGSCGTTPSIPPRTFVRANGEGGSIRSLPRSASVVQAEFVEFDDCGLSYGRIREYVEYAFGGFGRENPRRAFLLGRSCDVRAEVVADALPALECAIVAPKVGRDLVWPIRRSLGQSSFVVHCVHPLSFVAHALSLYAHIRMRNGSYGLSLRSMSPIAPYAIILRTYVRMRVLRIRTAFASHVCDTPPTTPIAVPNLAVVDVIRSMRALCTKFLSIHIHYRGVIADG